MLAAGGVEIVVNAPASGGFARHSHDEYVISANVCGVERVRLDRRTFTLGTDEVTLYNPGEVQSCRADVPDDEQWACVSVYLDPAVVTRRLGHEAEFHEPMVAAPRLRTELLGLVLPATDDASRRVDRLLDTVFGAVRLGEPRADTALAEARSWFEGPVPTFTPLNMADVAARLGWSRETFTRRFTAATGTPPYAWHLQSRLRAARRRLRAGHRPSRVAADLGFTDQAHLHRHFVAAYALTPDQARRSAP